jgi:ATP-dependent exoDNAse (exonuclease V) beta subunit
LSNSYRSTPELVQLCNALFVPAFQRSLALPEGEVRLTAQRPSISPAQPCAEFFNLSSGIINKGNGNPKKPTNEQKASALAEGIAQLLDRKDACRVFDKQSRQLRAAKLGDIAILCRTNDSAAEIASALSQRGFSVSLSQSGLLATPEARLAMACLRRLADPTDTLATAEIIALEGALQAEEWLESRLDYVARGNGSGNGSGDRWGLNKPFVHRFFRARARAQSRHPFAERSAGRPASANVRIGLRL